MRRDSGCGEGVRSSGKGSETRSLGTLPGRCEDPVCFRRLSLTALNLSFRKTSGGLHPLLEDGQENREEAEVEKCRVNIAPAQEAGES